MPIIDQILNLVTKSLEDMDDPNSKLSAVIRKSIRIARLRNDYNNLLWLEWEMIEWGNDEARNRIDNELFYHYTDELFKVVRKQLAEEYISERKCLSIKDGKIVNQGQIIGMGVEDLESRLQYLDRMVEDAVPPEGLTPIDLYFIAREKTEDRNFWLILAQDNRKILARIRHRVYSFLSTTEHQLLFGKLNSDIFEQNKIYVDSRLKEICPDAINKFSNIYNLLNKNDGEARSHALVSCRRILKDLADALYPPTSCEVTTSDGKNHKLTEEKFISRLWQFVSEKMFGQTSGNLLLAGINDLGARLDKVYDLSCKGVHSDVTEFEMNQCVIQTYLLIGDILRLHDNNTDNELENYGEFQK